MLGQGVRFHRLEKNVSRQEFSFLLCGRSFESPKSLLSIYVANAIRTVIMLKRIPCISLSGLLLLQVGRVAALNRQCGRGLPTCPISLT
jgi:hypothetical protein